MDETKLKVLYVQPPSPRKEGSKEGLLPHPSGPDGGNTNHQDVRTLTLCHLFHYLLVFKLVVCY
jgi:hypothetical protein